MPFADLLKRYRRVAITGAPRTGKTSLTSQVSDRPVLHTDDWMHSPWADVPLLVNAACDTAGGSFVVEGVQVPRALRKGLEVDAVVYLTSPKVAQSPAQVGMGKGIDTVLTEWRAANPNVPVFTEQELSTLTMDSADAPPTSRRRYLQFTVDGASYEPTPQGGRRYAARASKVGVFKYNRGGVVVREYRPADEIKKALHSLKSAPVVLLHPKENGGEVSPINMRKLRVGVFEDPVWNDETQAAEGHVIVDDSEAIDLIDAWGGKVSISCGYDNDWLNEPGVSPGGDEYDRVQVDYVFNHVGIGPSDWGRQGNDVGLLTLDADDNEEDPMKVTTTDSKDPVPAVKPVVKTADEGGELPSAGAEALSPDDIKALKQLVQLLPVLNQLVNTGSAPAPAAAPTLDAPPPAPAAPAPGAPIEPEKKTLDNANTKTLDANDIERIAQEGAEVRADAQRLLGGDYSFKGKSTRQVKVDVVKTFDSAFDDKGISDVEVGASYRMASKALEQKSELSRQLGETRGVEFTLDSGAADQVKPLGHDIYSA